MGATYANAVIREGFTILGLPLRDFSLGHWLLMRRFACGFAEDEAKRSPQELIADFILAVVICSLTYEDFLTAIRENRIRVNEKGLPTTEGDNTVNFADWLKSYGKAVDRLIARPWLRRSARALKWLNRFIGSKTLARLVTALNNASKNKRFSILDVISAFGDYMRFELPKYWENETDGAGESGAHWSQSLLCMLTGQLGYTRSQALNAPLSQAFADAYKLAETNGRLILMTEDEIDLVEQMEGTNGAR
jgi:hypothetical protein